MATYLEVYARKSCPACQALMGVLASLPSEQRLRVLVHDVADLPPATGGVGPTRIPVIVQVRARKLHACPVHHGALSLQALRDLLSE